MKKIYYDGKTVKKYLYSGIFFIIIMAISVCFAVGDEAYGELMILLPVAGLAIVKTGMILKDFIKIIKHNICFLEMTEEELIYHTISDREIRIKLSDIRETKIEDGSIYVVMYEKTGEDEKGIFRKIFKYYLERLEDTDIW